MRVLPRPWQFLSSPPKTYAEAYRRAAHLPSSNAFSLAQEESMGLVPSRWSVSSAMNDTRPNGRSIFDARFCDSPMGRARASGGVIIDPRALVSPFGTTGTKGAHSLDATIFAADMKDETDAAALSEKKFGNLSVH